MTAVEYRGNLQEIPGDLPAGEWARMVRMYHADPTTSELAWYHPVLEYLDPRRLAVVRAKARVWREVTGRLPDNSEVNKWWEVRAGRRDGQVPQRRDIAVSQIDADNILHCGECGARYSPDRDGTHNQTRCNLCGVMLIWREP